MRGSAFVDVERSHGTLTAKAAAMIGALRPRFAIWRNRARYRRALARMSERELADIGVSWSDIAEEVNKPFWRP
jgi:uncharacterized protein YjiS (DUF1127 family)